MEKVNVIIIQNKGSFVCRIYEVEWFEMSQDSIAICDKSELENWE